MPMVRRVDTRTIVTADGDKIVIRRQVITETGGLTQISISLPAISMHLAALAIDGKAEGREAARHV